MTAIRNPRAERGPRPAARTRRRASAAVADSAATLIMRSVRPWSHGRPAGTRGHGLPVFLVEDNRLLREGLESMLGGQGLRVVATAGSGTQALRKVTKLKPQLVLLDSALGDQDCLRLVESVKKVSPAIKVIVMHLLPSQDDVAAYVRAGVSGFIMKDASVTEFVASIRTVMDGGSVLPPAVTATLFSHVAEQTLAQGKRRLKAALRLTAREREVMNLIGEGLSNREIAKRLRIAAFTVKSHVHNILEKLALRTRLEVAAFAHANGGQNGHA